MKNSICGICCLVLFSVSGQKGIKLFKETKDTVGAYTLYTSRIIAYADLGSYMAPFTIRNQFTPLVGKLTFQDNPRVMMGIGGIYKWLSFRISFPLFGNALSLSKYGKSAQFSIGGAFTIKKTYFDIDLRTYTSYALVNADAFTTPPKESYPNLIRSKVQSTYFSIASWYFHNKQFRMSALQGKTGHYNREVMTWYVKSSLNVFSISNGNNPIVPSELVNTDDSKTMASFIGSTELSCVPGYAYVNRIRNWQFAGLIGVGAAFQLKNYTAQSNTRAFLGVAPRFDFKLIGGYSFPSYFAFIQFVYDNKSVVFNDFVYRQNFFSVQLAGGYRFNYPKKKQKTRK